MPLGLIRRACRKHVLQVAKVRHESAKLPNSSFWNRTSFQMKLLKICLQATRESKTLMEKYDVFAKKKRTDYGGQSKLKRSHSFVKQ